ncbi:MAG: Flp pilus assembly complex ATPase component TadA [Candidatus Margulisbacteria bacterium]|nr:Flp pilus assembly complex ATPase component TadA [Candidatus Margulisiibacteriota bacterium]
MNPVKEINEMLDNCLSADISDVHIETFRDFFRVRYREDGLLRLWRTYSLPAREQFFTRLKIMAGLDTNRYGLQDGRFTYKERDVRLAVMPVFQGEKIVLRILSSTLRLTLSELGLPGPALVSLRANIRRPAGLLLVTGPTGSGKTTTLYSLLKLLDCAQKNIVTIEDPIEYQLPGINQVQINAARELDFASVLRAVLRQDPDIIFIGEIRDEITARIAVRAALTGHLVLATLHTRDTQEAFARLLDLGIAEYLLRAVLLAVLSQRLYRRLCAADPRGFRGRSGFFEYRSFTDQVFYSFEQSRQDILQQGLTIPDELQIC